MTSYCDSDSPREHSIIEVELPPSENKPASKVLDEWKQLAAKLENESPRRSSEEVWQEIILQVVMPFLDKVEQPETDHFHSRGHSEVSRPSRGYDSHPVHHFVSAGASYINPSTLQLVSDVSYHTDHWGVGEGHSPHAHLEYVIEDSQEASTSYEVVPPVAGIYGMFPGQDFGFPHAHPLPLPYPVDVRREVYPHFI